MGDPEEMLAQADLRPQACLRLQHARRYACWLRARCRLGELAAVKLQRAWLSALASLLRHVTSGELIVLVVANLGIAGVGLPQGIPNGETRQMHIHTTLHHAAQGAAFLVVNEYGWSKNVCPGGSPAVQKALGLTLTTRQPTEPSPAPLHDGPSSCWCYAAQEQVTSPSGFPSIPGTEHAQCHSFIASRHSGAFVVERMPSTFYQNLPKEAYEGRFVCCKAKWCDERRVHWPGAAAGEQLPSHFLLATYHGPRGGGHAVVQQLCTHLRRWCDEARSLYCVLAGDFNVVLQPGYHPTEYAGFKRLDPDEAVRRDGCGTERPHPHRLREAEWSKKMWRSGRAGGATGPTTVRRRGTWTTCWSFGRHTRRSRRAGRGASVCTTARGWACCRRKRVR